MRYLLILLFSSNVFAYSQEKIAINDYTFKRFVLYQTRNIVQDYKSVQSYYLENKDDSSKWRKQIQQVQKESRSLNTNCPKNITPQCREKITNILTELKKLEKSVILSTESLKTDLKNEKLLHLQIRNLNSLNESILKAITKVEMVKNSSYYDVQSLDNESLAVIQAIDEVYFSLNDFLNSLTPSEYYEEFKNVFAHFIKPLENEIYLNKNKDFLKYHLNELNINWHKFNMYFTKINKKTPKSVETLLKTIGNRWNNILRLILKN